MPIKPIPYPKTGPVQKLKLNIAPGEADVFIHQKEWPRQKQNPKWRIEVTNIEGRYDEITRTLLRDACEETARLYMKRWLAKVAPLLTLETVSWQELVQLATQPSFKMMSEYQRRRNGHPKRHTDSDILVSRKKEKVEPVE